MNTTLLETAQEVTLSAAVQTFMNDELIAKADLTVEWYRCRLGLFVTALGPDRPLSAIGKSDLQTWWKTLQARTRTKPPDLTVDTMHGYVRAGRRFLLWLYDEHQIIADLTRYIPLPSIPERQRKGVDKKDALRILAAAKHDSPRDYALLLFLESTGARRGGVASLTLDDIHPHDPEPLCRRAAVHEKGGRCREVVMSAEALAALRAWLKIRQSSTEYVFVDERPGHDAGLLPGAINQILARYKKSLGLKGKVSPHQWRHCWSRSRLQEGMPLSITSQLLGHKSITVTAQIYGNLLMDELHQQYDKYYKPPDSDEKPDKRLT